MKKITSRIHLLLLYLTAIALLAGQGTNAHIHLAEFHHHDGNHHHFAEQSVSLADHANVIELDSDYRTPTPEQQKKPLTALTYDPPRLSVAGASIQIKPPPHTDGWLGFPELSTRHPRAPPLS